MNVRVIRASSESQSALAKRYGVGETAINSIKRGKSWKHLD